MIYLDNAATSYPKPPGVIDAISECVSQCGANPGRGTYQMAMKSARVLYTARERLAKLFNVSDSKNIIFTANATIALNMAIKGVVKKGDHVITTMVEHNSVLRPLTWLAEHFDVEVTKVDCYKDGSVDMGLLRSSIKENTALIAINHASNIIGGILDIDEISLIAKDNQIPILIDAAQTAGYLDIDVEKSGIDLLAFAGHKSLLGPQGTGGLYISPGLEVEELIQGGTGTQSAGPQPGNRPEKYESGTPNTIGIAGLGAGIEVIVNEGLNAVRSREKALIDRLIGGLLEIPAYTIYGPKPGVDRVPLVAVNLDGMTCHMLAHTLDKAFNIAVRGGLHCAPDAHTVMGTEDTGALRLSVGFFNTEKDIDDTIKALEIIAADSSSK